MVTRTKGIGVDLHTAVIIIPVVVIVWSIVYFWTGSNQAFGIDCKSHVTEKVSTWAAEMRLAGAQPEGGDQIMLSASCVQYVTREGVKFTDEPDVSRWKNQFGDYIVFEFTGIAATVGENEERKLLPSDRPYKVRLSPPATVVFEGA